MKWVSNFALETHLPFYVRDEDEQNHLGLALTLFTIVMDKVPGGLSSEALLALDTR